MGLISDVILTRLKIGHTKLTHGYLMSNNPSEKCDQSNTDITIKYILQDCPTFNYTRRKYNMLTDVKEAISDRKLSIATISFTNGINLRNLI
ncbi:hypothetical protein ANTRET_LOCUS5386 [Anthophora retusa]